jgi:hypothetical protein
LKELLRRKAERLRLYIATKDMSKRTIFFQKWRKSGRLADTPSLTYPSGHVLADVVAVGGRYQDGFLGRSCTQKVNYRY